MATVNEQIVTGRKFRKLIDEATKLWQRISFWTKASDVEFDDGSTAETKMGAINGITDSLVSTSSNIAASAKALNQLNNKLAGLPEWIQDNTGKITGYKTPGGADTVFPFSDISNLKLLLSAPDSGYAGYRVGSYTCTKEYQYYFAINNNQRAIVFTDATQLGYGVVSAGNGQPIRYCFLKANPGCVISEVSDVWGIL